MKIFNFQIIIVFISITILYLTDLFNANKNSRILNIENDFINFLQLPTPSENKTIAVVGKNSTNSTNSGKNKTSKINLVLF